MSGCHDGNPIERVKYEYVFVACDNHIGHAGERCLKHHVVLRVATGSNPSGGRHHGTPQQNEPQHGRDICFIEALFQANAPTAQYIHKLIEQRLRDNEAVVSR